MATDTSTHESYARDEEIKGSTDRAFGIVFVVVFLIIGLWPVMWGNAPRIWSLSIAGVLLLLALVRPTLLAPLPGAQVSPGLLAGMNRLWMKFGLLLHKITNPLIMGLVFFLAVLPTGLIMRMLGKDILRCKLDPDAKSYWIERAPPGPDPDSMPNQF